MKRKIKALTHAISVMAMTVPALAMAQFQQPGGTGLSNQPIFRIVENLMRWLLGLVGIVGVIGFAIAGILYLTAAGDEDRIETAKRAMVYSIVGVVVALLGLVIIMAVRRMTDGSNSKF